MKEALTRFRRRTIVALGGGLALLAVGVSVALATSGSPGSPPASASTLANVAVVNNANMNFNQIKFHNPEAVQIIQISNSAGPGFASGWHMHNGPVLITVTAGSLTFYDRADREGAECRVTTVTAGHGYIETAGTPLQARNEGEVTASWVTTQIIPQGSALRVDVPEGFCGV